MVGDQESSVTYPSLFLNAEGVLHFSYRIGGSGDGTTIWNRYDTSLRSWSRLTDQGLFNGQGAVNAYHNYTPIEGPDGRFHIVFMWRETPVANTNFHISHIASADLLNWETYAGEGVTIPVTPDTPGVVVDPVESRNGLINMGFGIGWDQSDRPIVTYHKYDEVGLSQYFNTRLEGGNWVIHQTSAWPSFKWDLDREGSLAPDVQAGPVTVDPENRLIQTSHHVQHGAKTWVLDEEILAIEEALDEHPAPVVAELMQVRDTFPNMTVHLNRYGDRYLRWETLPINQDRDPGGPYPDPSQLTLYRLGP